jgi:DinB superfamily
MERCTDCGFEYDLDAALDAGPQIVSTAGEIADVIEGAPVVSTRRSEGVWSPLEYGCHVRDVLLVQRERVLTARRTERPRFDSMGRDERVDHDGYSEQDPSAVARQLRDAALLFAHVLARLEPDDWDRTVHYIYPVPAERSLRWVAEHTLHETRHHQLDIARQVS